MSEALKLSASQFEALDAVLHGHPFSWIRSGAYGGEHPKAGQPYFTPGRSMGGAKRRMAEGLQERGLLSRRPYDREIAKEFQEWDFQLTAKGLRALDSHLRNGRRYDPTDGRLKMIRDQLAAREAKEARLAEAIAAKEARQKTLAAAKAGRQRAAHMAELRKRLAAHGLEAFASGLDDEGLLAFVRDIEGAEYAMPAEEEEPVA